MHTDFNIIPQSNVLYRSYYGIIKGHSAQSHMPRIFFSHTQQKTIWLCETTHHAYSPNFSRTKIFVVCYVYLENVIFGMKSLRMATFLAYVQLYSYCSYTQLIFKDKIFMGASKHKKSMKFLVLKRFRLQLATVASYNVSLWLLWL